jgi:hypothetical protein
MPAIQIAHSIVAGHQPILQLPGQIGINEADGLLYMRDASGNAMPVLMGIPGMLYGGNTGNNGGSPTSSIDIAPAVVAADLAPYPTMILSSTLTKNVTVNWVVGTNQGGLDTGSVGNNTYHLFLIRRPDTGVVDALFSLSPTSPSMPPNYTQKRRIASIVRKAAANLLYNQNGDEFLLSGGIGEDISGSSASTSGTLFTMTAPTGIKVILYVWGNLGSGTDNFIWTSPDQSATVPVGDIGIFTGGSQASVRTNTSAQIRATSRIGTGLIFASSFGWLDTRGRT